MSWPVPRPGLVIRYSYLWESEAGAGREEGVKDRPCAIILVMYVSIHPETGPIMEKYALLGDFLRRQRALEVTLTFDEIERITGVKLPPKAQHHRAWWSNNPSNNVMTKVWLAAGYETAQVDMSARKLVFRRVRKPGAGESLPSPASPRAAAKPGERHPLFGALKGLVRIPPGVDITEPADPEWADRLDADDRRF